MPLRLFGLETEYGITRTDQTEVDPVIESMALVRAHAEHAINGVTKPSWDYAAEDPHQDARGFRVSGLQQDKEEEAFAELDAHRPFSFREMKSDLVLSNGARFYNDHTHPEYSTPECRTLRDLVAHDRAGERIVQRAADRRNRELGADLVQLYKNNTDYHGHSYGCHDNYLLPRVLPFGELAAGLMPFLVSRQIFAGTGKAGIETAGGFEAGRFQLSQRADFIETELSVDTMQNRPIVNTRDEPHADRRRYRRLHLIIGDANMSEYATALKVGTTRVVLDLLLQGHAPTVALEDPVAAVRILSRDTDLKALVVRKTGGTMTGLEIQEAYLSKAQQIFSGLDDETDWILHEWEDVLRLAVSDRARLIGRIDWITKQWLLETFLQEERLSWDDPWVTSLDLEYHNINPERGLYRGLEAEGKVARVATDTEVQAALTSGPADTRAGIRGLCIRHFGTQVAGVQWERVVFHDPPPGIPQTVEMDDLFDPEAVRALVARLERAADIASREKG